MVEAQSVTPISIDELQVAEKSIIRCIQYEHFIKELRVLQNLKVTGEILDRQITRERNSHLKKTSSFYPYIDGDGIIRVGGRIDRAHTSVNIKHPMILPRKSHVTELVVGHYHQKINHYGPRDDPQRDSSERLLGDWWLVGCI